MKTRYLILVLLPFTMAGRCWDEPLTAGEAREALEEVSLSTQALTLASGSVEITTDFTIGQAVEEAAEEIGQFIESQLPCAAITIVGATLTVEYGANPGDCIYNGQRYSGTHTITVKSAEAGNLVVEHEWSDFSNDRITVSGNATVTWSAPEASRQVVHELTWTRLSDNRVVTGRGNRVQTVLSGGIFEGIEVNGDRSWESPSGDWDLDIDHVQMRWIDPVPQSGSYQLDTPFDKTLEMSFDRVDENTIRVTVSSGSRSFEFNVSSFGVISD